MGKILIAEDVPESRESLAELLERGGHEVVTVATGAEAFAFSQAASPEMIVSGLLLPVLDGFELCRRCKRDERLGRVPFVVLAATGADPEDERLALGLGADRFLVWPQPGERILEVVGELLAPGRKGLPKSTATAPGDEVALFRRHHEARCRQLWERIARLEHQITERDRVEAAQAESARRFGQLSESSLDVVWAVGLEGNFSYLSPAVEGLLGHPPQELLGRRFDELLLPEERREYQQKALAALEALAAGREVDLGALHEMELRHADGSTVWAEVSAGPMRGAGGQCVGVQGIARDITRRKRVEDELRSTNRFVDSVIEHLPDTVFVKDARDLRFTRINRAGEALLGYPREELLGKTDHDLFPAEQADLFVAKDREVLRGRTVVEIAEEWVTTRCRGQRLLHTKKLPVLDAAGEPEFLLGITEDITERKQQTAALQESENLLRIAGRIARLGGWSIDLAEGRVLWSDEVAAIHGCAAGHSPALEKGISFYTPEWRARITEVFGACARDGIPYDEEMQIISADGQRRWVRTLGEAIRDRSGVITKVQGAFQDITERRSEAEERKRLEHQLQQAQKLESIGGLAGGVAHDFNNLLSVILSYAGFALREVREQDPLFNDLAEIRDAGERAAALTRQLLAFSRRQLLRPEVLSLNQVVSGIERMLRRLLGEDIEIEVRLAEDLGSVMADPSQMEQVLMNLSVNARDAMPGGGKLVVETKNVECLADSADRDAFAVPGAFVQLSVADTGIGMDATTRERVFEPFFTTKELGRGTGLGLSTVYGIVKQSGGSIRVLSEPGRGTRFEIMLPRVEAAATRDTRRPVPAIATGSERVLIAEDEEAVRRIAERILRSAGYRVYTAANGGEALLLCEKLEGAIDLLLTDVVMPQLNGRELSVRLARLCPGLKTLYMSGYTDDAIAYRGVLEPGVPFVAKPFSAAELTRRVREVLDAG